VIRYGLAAWVLAAVSLTGLWIGLNWLVDLLWPTRYGNTADGRPSCECGNHQLGDGLVAIHCRGKRHSIKECE
jgi:hypothetical protein